MAINRPPVADRSPIFRNSCRRPVADWSATEKCSFWSHSGCIGYSCFLVARQSPTGCSTCVTGALLAATKTSLRPNRICNHLQPVADQTPTSLQPPCNLPATTRNFSRKEVADRLQAMCDRGLRIIVANQSPYDLQPNKCSFDRTVVALVAAIFSRKAVADRLQYLCDRGLVSEIYCKGSRQLWTHVCPCTVEFN